MNREAVKLSTLYLLLSCLTVQELNDRANSASGVNLQVHPPLPRHYRTDFTCQPYRHIDLWVHIVCVRNVVLLVTIDAVHCRRRFQIISDYYTRFLQHPDKKIL